MSGHYEAVDLPVLKISIQTLLKPMSRMSQQGAFTLKQVWEVLQKHCLRHMEKTGEGQRGSQRFSRSQCGCSDLITWAPNWKARHSPTCTRCSCSHCGPGVIIFDIWRTIRPPPSHPNHSCMCVHFNLLLITVTQLLSFIPTVFAKAHTHTEVLVY